MKELKNIVPGAMASAETAVSRTAKNLSRISLEMEEGDYLGSESDLLQRLAVSRPTLRQAAKILESDRLISVRRGVNGGFYAARPNSRDANQSPALWLSLHDATIKQMARANCLIAPVVCAEAADCTDETLIQRLRGILDEVENYDPATISHRDRVKHDSDLISLIGEMAGDPVLRLFLDIGYVFGLLQKETGFYRDLPDRQEAWRDLQIKLCKAILARDPDLSRLIAIRRSDITMGWIESDMANLETDYGST